MAKWYHIPKATERMTEREYRANIDGINIVFGAVLGFVLVGAEGLPVSDFIGLLALSVAIVVMILYMSSSKYKLFYTLMAGASVFALPYISEDLFSLAKVPKLQPTLAMWALMILGLELLPRKQSNSQPDQENNQ